MIEGHFRPGNNQWKGPEVGSQVRILEEQREGQCCWVRMRALKEDVTGQVVRGRTEPPCRSGEGWEVFPMSSGEIGTGFPGGRGGVVSKAPEQNGERPEQLQLSYLVETVQEILGLRVSSLESDSVSSATKVPGWHP